MERIIEIIILNVVDYLEFSNKLATLWSEVQLVKLYNFLYVYHEKLY